MWRVTPVAILLLAAAPASTAEPSSGSAAPPADMTVSSFRGEMAVRSRCASCHAVELNDVSPNPDAPPLRDIGGRYPVENLEEALAEGIMVSHDQDMPTFVLSPEETTDIIAYLRELHLQTPAPEKAW